MSGSLLQKPQYPKNGDEHLMDSKGWFTLEWKLGWASQWGVGIGFFTSAEKLAK